MILVGALGAVLGVLLRVPAGAMIGALLAVGALNLLRERSVSAPGSLGPLARITVGTVVGSLATREVVASLGASVGWALGATVAMIVAGGVVALTLQRWAGLDRATAMIAMAPGGLAEMVALADEVGARVEVVAGMHLARKFAALAVGATVLVVAR